MTWVRRIIIAVAIGLGTSALAKELAQPRGFRVGEGRIFGIPYSFRLLQGEELVQRYWNPSSAMIAPPLFGVGMLPNIPAILQRLGLWPQSS